MPPGVIVFFGLECAPAVVADFPRDSDALRFGAWIDRHPEYGELLARVTDLATDEERAT